MPGVHHSQCSPAWEAKDPLSELLYSRPEGDLGVRRLEKSVKDSGVEDKRHVLATQ